MSTRGTTWWVFAVFAAVLAADLLLIASVGTDVPFHDQWDVEGKWLYPAWLEGSLRVADLFRACNEHRIAWTHTLNLLLFAANGQWDPLLQVLVTGVMRAGCAALLAWRLGKPLGAVGQLGFGLVAFLAFLPHLAWHAVLWGYESQVYFAIGFSWLAFAALSGTALPPWRTAAGFGAGAAAMVAMAAGELVPAVLIGLWLLRLREDRGWGPRRWKELAPLLVLLVLAAALHTEGGRNSEWRPKDVGEFVLAAGRALAWPHVASPFAAVAMNIPIGVALALRLLRRRGAAAGEDFVLTIAGWSAVIALAAAWARGGGPELAVGVPSRYVDFVVGLPLANIWTTAVLLREVSPTWRRRAAMGAACWALFVVVGWLGISVEVMTRLILPRARDVNAPVRLVRAFQASGDPAVFDGQPRLHIPHPDLRAVQAVLNDPRMRGRLPPSLQPERPMGRLSRFVRFILGRD